jgi:hypothetical protein
MNDNEFDLAARAWLEDGPTRMSDRAVLSALAEIHTTRQRRPLWPAWRATPVSIFARVAIAAVLVVAVGVLAVNVVPRQPDGSSVGGSPTPSSSASPAHVLDFPDLTTTFVSPRNGFSVKYFDRGGGTVTPATQDGFDVVETGLAAVFKGTSTENFMDEVAIDESGRLISPDEQIDHYLSDDDVFGRGCGVPRAQQAEITIDGQSGRIAECPNRIEATVTKGGKLYVFILLHDRSDARAVFDAFAATIELTPETALHFPAMTTTFVSPTYGYSFNYLDRGGLAPATEPWDPGNQPLDDRNFDGRFDGVETGFRAYFESASTPIRDGVSIDAWVDQFVTPLTAGGCGLPRSQQADITIDGHPGRVAECPNRIEATVVAGGRLYLFILGHDRSDARAWFDAWIATVDLRPEAAAVPSISPSS